MLKLIHAADFHLDSPFSGLPPEQASQRRAEQRQLLERLGALAIEEHADLVLLSGDLLDGDRVYRETADALSEALGRIPARIFLSPGNHDPYTPLSPYAQPIWPDNVHIFTSSVPQGISLPELNCTVYGAAFTQEHMDHSPLEGFHAPQDGLIHLMAVHGDVGGGDYGPIAPADIASSGLDYLALGHIHKASGLQRAGATYWAYPGCPEGRGFDELGDKGALVVQIDSSGVTARFRSLCKRRYEILSVDLTGAQAALPAVEAALPARTQQDIFRIRLVGEYAMDPSERSELCRTLSPRFYALEVQDHTRMPRNLWGRVDEDTLTGLFLREMRSRCQRSPEDETAQLAVRFGLAALEHGEDVSP